MGFVYNNVWEAFFKTYLELNGFFVLTNTFVALTDQTAIEENRQGMEADIIAYKLSATNLDPYYLDRVPDNQPDRGEFFAGENRQANLVYCEIKANLRGHEINIDDLIADRSNPQAKLGLIQQRFNLVPQGVIVAYSLTNTQKDLITQSRWKHKEFPSIFRFLERRFRQHRENKGRVFYNDPWLEIMRMLDALCVNGKAAHVWHEDISDDLWTQVTNI